MSAGRVAKGGNAVNKATQIATSLAFALALAMLVIVPNVYYHW
jgi:hypothetical protein